MAGKLPEIEPILDIQGLKVHFFTEDGEVLAIEDVSLRAYPGETLGIVGESGSGKSVTALSILQLIPQPPGRILSGKVYWVRQKGDPESRGKKVNLVELPLSELRKIRGNEISMIFQDPMTSLNPVLTIGDQIMENILLHQGVPRAQAKEKAVKLLELAGIPDPSARVDDYPFQFSGGMRQRVMIAIALASNPSLLIADEPTTSLDVTIQAQVLDLIKTLKKSFNTAVILITHDVGVIAETCERVAVMYAGYIVEYSDVYTIFKNPKHPYTIGLLGAIPDPTSARDEPLTVIPGAIPNLIHPPSGCRFHPRCGHAMDICSQKIPMLEEISPGHQVRCFLFSKEA